MVRREVRFVRWLCRWALLRAITPDVWEDLRRLSAQLVMIGLPPLATTDLSARADRAAVERYLSLIQPHLTSDQLPYAGLCASRFVEERAFPPPISGGPPRMNGERRPSGRPAADAYVS